MSRPFLRLGWTLPSSIFGRAPHSRLLVKLLETTSKTPLSKSSSHQSRKIDSLRSTFETHWIMIPRELRLLGSRRISWQAGNRLVAFSWSRSTSSRTNILTQVAELYNRGNQFTPLIVHWKSGNTSLASRPYVSFFQLYDTASTVNVTVTPYHLSVTYPITTLAGTTYFRYLIGDIPAPYWAAGQNVSQITTVLTSSIADVSS